MKYKLKKILLTASRYLALVIAVIVFTFALSNFPAFVKIVGFWYHSHLGNSSAVAASDLKISSDGKDDGKLSKEGDGKILENHIIIPKISVDSPISWQINNNEEDIQAALENGVVNVAGSSLPDQRGNVFITGHSSNYVWAKGEYKTIFALLGTLKVGDLIYLRYRNIPYVYRTVSSETVRPNRTDVMQKGDKTLLTLMTCVPVGTSINRLVVKAELIGNRELPKISTQKNSQDFIPDNLK